LRARSRPADRGLSGWDRRRCSISPHYTDIATFARFTEIKIMPNRLSAVVNYFRSTDRGVAGRVTRFGPARARASPTAASIQPVRDVKPFSTQQIVDAEHRHNRSTSRAVGRG
jgi:hypothetical protein